MHIRKPFAGAFVVLLLLSAYLGLAPSGQKAIPRFRQSDKALHFITFLLLTLCFYWILETNRRRVLHLTLFVCPFALGVGSEIVQGLLPNGRDFDPYDIVANVVGSFLALGLCTWYHKRMLERKRMSRSYSAVPGDDGDVDVELGEGTGPQETGVTDPTTDAQEAEDWNNTNDNWDEADSTNITGIEAAGKKAAVE